MSERAEPQLRGGDEPEKAPRDQAPESTTDAQLTPQSVLQLQSAAGNGAVQRLLGRSPATAAAPALPSIAHLPATAQTLLEGVLEKDTIDEAVRQIYDNMFQRTGWTYNASVKDTSGKSFINGGKTSGMCESYRNAFAEILRLYDGLRPTHPTDAIKNGVLNIHLGNTLNDQRVATRKGLTLMGATALKGNVYLEADGDGTPLDANADSINTFIFSGHWTLKVNGTEYDPIFHSIDEANVQHRLDLQYSYGPGRYLANPSKPILTNEFGATFVHVTDWATFKGIIDDVEALYQDKAGDIAAIASGKTWKQLKRGIVWPAKSSAGSGAADIFDRIADKATFDEIVAAAYTAGRVTRDQRNAYTEVSKLA